MTDEDDEDHGMNEAVATAMPKREEDSIYELVKAMLTAAAIALVIRSFIFEPFNIPSGSLLPTLQIGDYLFVEKYAYGYSQYSFPFGIIKFHGRVLEKQVKRGDIAVFRQPKKPEINYIKRIVGLPGDKIQVKGGILNINGNPVMRDFRNAEVISDDGRTSLYRRYIETLPNGVQHYIYEISDSETLDNTPVYTVPEGYYFAMGDNRDASQDSRVMDAVGFVPAENLVGRAWFIFFSTEGAEEACPFKGEGVTDILSAVGCKLVTWPKAIRYSRFLKPVNSL